MSAPLTFGDFYAPIRSHFSSNVWDYEKFKRCKDNRAKVEYLIGHAVVQTALNGLASRNILTPLCSFFGPPEIKEKCQGVDWKARIIQSQGKYPQLSSKVEVKASKKKGRMLVAKEKIEAGQVLIHERAYCTLLYKDNRGSHCNSCFRRLIKDHQTCPHCKQVNYCSEACKASDFDWFHWAECGLMDCLQDESVGRLALLVYRLMVKSGLEKCIDTHDADLALTEKNCCYDSLDYASVYLQVAHEDQRDPGDAFKRAAIGLYLAHHLKLAGFFPSSTDSFYEAKNETLVKMVTLMLRHLQSCSCNAYEIDEFVRDSRGQMANWSMQIGGAIYPTVSLSNHSCGPNTTRNYEGSTCIVRASCTIRKGEEITDNYGLFYQIRPQDERCEALSKQYFFACDCAPCKLHWPTFDEVRGRPSVLVCSGCRTPLNCDPAKLKKCVKCKKEVKSAALKVQRLLAGLNNEVQKALEDMKQTPTKADVVEAILARFLDFLKLLEFNVQHPSADFLTCQHVVAQCYALKSNNYVK